MGGWLDTLGIPGSWHFYVTSLAAMLALASLDFCGAICAKEWTLRNHPLLLGVGLLSFGVLFIVYARILETAELSIVTIGWVVFLQVGLLLIDRFRYGVDIPPLKWMAIVVILLLQVYLVLGPNGDGEMAERVDTGVMVASAKSKE